jgi:hypothetical protein
MGVARMIPASQGDLETPSMRSSLRTLPSYGAVISSAICRGRKRSTGLPDLVKNRRDMVPELGRALAHRKMTELLHDRAPFLYP